MIFNQQALPLAPRPSNTGAQNGSRVKIDWLDFTVTGVGLYEVCKWLLVDPADFGEGLGPAAGHTERYQVGDIVIFHHPEKSSVKVRLPASALDSLPVDHLDLLRKALHVGASINRLDICFDDFSGTLTPDRLRVAESAGEVVTHFREFDSRQPFDRRERVLTGDSVHYGSRAGMRFIRCYDKRLEQINRHRVDPADLPASWCRLELETKKKAALVLAARLSQLGLGAIPSLIRGVLDLRSGNSKRASDRSPLQWWVDLLDAPEIIRSGVQRVKTSVEDALKWVSFACKRNLARVVAGFGSPALIQIVEDGLDRLTHREWLEILPPGQHSTRPYFESKQLKYLCPF